MALYDERVGILESIAVASDVKSLGMFDFDVLAASALIDGEEMPDYPLMDSRRSAEGFAVLAEDCSRRIDRIWSFVGGLSVQGLERLALWALRNRERANAFRHGLGPACAAFVYGERELAQALLAEVRSEWEDRLRWDPRQVIFDVYDAVRLDIERLEAAVRARTLH
jgi:hypothetical protein